MAEEKQNVLIVHNHYQIPGGEDTVVANEKKMLESYGHKVILYSRDNKEIKGFSKRQKLLLPFYSIFNVRTYRDIKRIIKREKIQIVHVHNTLHLISPSVYYAALSMKVPVVQTVHNFRLLCPGGTFYRDGHICEDCVMKGLWCAVRHGCYRGSRAQTLLCVINMKIHRMTGIYGRIDYICLTDFNKQKLLSFKQIAQERVFVKPNFAESAGRSVPGKERAEQFVFAGRLDRSKGIDQLLEVWKKIGEMAPKLILCGSGPLEKWCKGFIEKNKIDADMLGNVSNESVKKLIADSKALILPTQWYEGFPMSIVEAFSVGTPVICPDLGNAGSIVVEGVNGYKFPHGSRIQFLEAIKKIDAGIYEKTFKGYQDKYSAEVNYKMLREIYSIVTGCEGTMHE